MLSAALLASASCYAPDFAPCSVRCDGSAPCPDHMSCGSDSFCHASSGEPSCSAHDEDGDGVDDSVDVCPHIPGSQADQDGDGIGDDCDPEPTIPNQHLLLFATMQPGDVQLTLTPAWSQELDAVHFDGSGATAIQISGLPFQNVRVAIGVDITAVLGPTSQHQIALHAADVASAHDFVEINGEGSAGAVAISSFDGDTYSTVTSQDLTMGIHTGEVILQLTAVDGGTMQLDGGWEPLETYHLEAPSGFAPSTILHIDVNNLELDLKWLWAVAW